VAIVTATVSDDEVFRAFVLGDELDGDTTRSVAWGQLVSGVFTPWPVEELKGRVVLVDWPAVYAERVRAGRERRAAERAL
jgi:hypothetical protein